MAASIDELRQQVVRFLEQIGILTAQVGELDKKVEWLHDDGQAKDRAIEQLRDRLWLLPYEWAACHLRQPHRPPMARVMFHARDSARAANE